MTLASSFPLLLDLVLKSAAILLLAGVVGSVWRRASAANRHMIWLAALLVLLLLPLTKLAKPQWSYVWAPKTPRVSAAPAVVARMAPPISISTDAAEVTPAPSVRDSVTVNWAAVGVFTWLAGMGIVLLHRTGVRWRLARLAARSHPVSAEHWLGLVEDWPAGVEIRESTECRVPLAAGVWRPIVLLPTDALGWSEARLTAALRHEFGHIRRRDCLSRLLLDLACAIYWMNPLMWVAARAMRVAQEQACDDLVLSSGASAADYATQLVDVVRALGTERFTARHALAMAQPSTLETRVRAIVDADRDRRTLSGTTMTCGVLGAAFTLTLCSIAQLEGAEKKSLPKSGGAVADGPQIKVEAKFFEIASDAPDALSALPWLKDLRGSKAGTPGVSGEATGAVTASADVKTETADATILAQHAEVRPKNAAPAPTKSAAMEKAEKIILPKIEFVDATVKEAVDFFIAKSRVLDPEKSGVNIVLKLPKGDTTKLSLSLEDVPLSEALKYLAGLANLKINPEPNAIQLQPDTGYTLGTEPAARTPEAALLQRARAIVLPSVQFKDATVTECVEFLRAKSRALDPQKKSVNILMMPSKTSGDVKITPNLTNVSVADVLNYVAELSGLKLEVNASAFTLRPRAE